LPQHIHAFARSQSAGAEASLILVHSSSHLASDTAHGSGRLAQAAPVRVVLAEDHATMRRSLRLLLNDEPDIEVIAESGELSTAISQVRSLHPHVLVLDLRMPDGSSTDVVRGLRTQAPSTRIVVITMHEGHAFARQAHQAGALGFVLKDTADDELPEAVRRAARGEPYTSPRVSPHALRLRRV